MKRYRSVKVITASMLLVILSLLGCNKQLNSKDFESAANLSAALAVLKDKHEWEELWNAIGSDNEILLEQSLLLPTAVQEPALIGLRLSLRKNSIKPSSEVYDEKVFLQAANNVFKNDLFFWKAYAEIAHHAYLRNPKTGISMYRHLTDNPKLFEKLDSSPRLYSLYFNRNYKEAQLIAEEIINDKKQPVEKREFALIMSLKCQVKLDFASACLRILKVNDGLITTERFKKTMLELKSGCNSESR